MIKIIQIISRSTLGLKLFSIMGCGIYFLSTIFTENNNYIVEIMKYAMNISTTGLILTISIGLIILIIILNYIPKLLLCEKVFEKLIIKNITNICSAALVTVSCLFINIINKTDADINGQVMKTKLINIFKEFSLEEKKQWVLDLIKETKIRQDLTNIPLENIKNKKELLTNVLTNIENEKLKIVTETKRHHMQEILNYLSDHPYIILGSIVCVAIMSYFYYDTITTYLLSLGKTVNNIIKTQKEHAEVTRKLLENEQIMKDQITFILETLPKIAQRDEKIRALESIYAQVDGLAKITQDISKMTIENAERITDLQKAFVVVKKVLDENNISGVEQLL